MGGSLAKPVIGVNTSDLIKGSAKTAFFFVGGFVFTMSKTQWDKSTEKESACKKSRDYWLQYSIAEMKQHEQGQQQKKVEKKAAKKSSNPTRRHSRKNK